MEISIGCTGWGYDGWIGSFYPKNMPASDFLRHYSSIFDITEINSTFYGIPDQSTTRKWYSETPAHFRFTAKLPKIITHENKLQNTSAHLEQFLESMKPLNSKLSFVIMQLPPSLSFDDAKPRLEELKSFLSKNYIVEGRHESWFSDNALKYLSDNKICLVWNDVPGVKNPFPITSDFVYVRIIGDRSIPEKNFGKILRDRTNDLKIWADRLNQTINQISFGMIMANNHYEGFGPSTANKLRVLLGLEELVWSDKKQKTITDF
ncbi:MAG: DUF72 domain-containing protein [Thaumarchaeota archaeon]|nr:DUF72 domain-containing protein [Nitrososphaerota archaeon]